MNREGAHQDLEQMAEDYIVNKRRMPHDSFNSVTAISMSTGDAEEWSFIKKARTYEEYIGDVCSELPELAQIIIRKSNPDLVKEYNRIIAGINAAIGDGVTTQGQADRIRALVMEFKKVVYG